MYREYWAVQGHLAMYREYWEVRGGFEATVSSASVNVCADGSSASWPSRPGHLCYGLPDTVLRPPGHCIYSLPDTVLIASWTLYLDPPGHYVLGLLGSIFKASRALYLGLPPSPYAARPGRPATRTRREAERIISQWQQSIVILTALLLDADGGSRCPHLMDPPYVRRSPPHQRSPLPPVPRQHTQTYSPGHRIYVLLRSKTAIFPSRIPTTLPI